MVQGEMNSGFDMGLISTSPAFRLRLVLRGYMMAEGLGSVSVYKISEEIIDKMTFTEECQIYLIISFPGLFAKNPYVTSFSPGVL